MGEMVRVDSSELRALAKELRRARPEVYRAAQAAMLAAGEHMAESAKSRASWSSRIPGTIKVRADGLFGIKLVAGGGKNSTAPHAKPFEHAGQSGDFRHPVFADASKGRDAWTWTQQEARPFLHPAVMESLQQTAEAVADLMTEAIQQFLPE